MGAICLRLNQITVGSADFDASVNFCCELGRRLIVSSCQEYARFEFPDGEASFSLHLQDTVLPNAEPSKVVIHCSDISRAQSEINLIPEALIPLLELDSAETPCEGVGAIYIRQAASWWSNLSMATFQLRQLLTPVSISLNDRKWLVAS